MTAEHPALDTLTHPASISARQRVASSESGGDARGRGPDGGGVVGGVEAGGVAGDADGGQGSVLGVEHGRGRAHQAERALLVLERHPRCHDAIELLAQAPGGGDGAGGTTLERAAQYLDPLLFAGEGEQRLAQRGRVDRHAATHP